MKKQINLDRDVKKNLLLFSIMPLLILSILLIGKIYFVMESSYKTHFKITLVNINHKLNLFVNKIYKKETLLKNDSNLDLKTFVQSSDDINLIALLNQNGDISKFNTKQKRKLPKNAIKKLFDKYKKTSTHFFSYYLLGDQPTLFYTFAVKNGIYIININLQELKEYINFIKKDEKFQIALIDKEGEYIYCSSKNIDTKKSFYTSKIYNETIKKHKEFSYFEFYNPKMDMDNFFMYTKNKKLHWIIFIIDESESLDDRVLIMAGWTVLFVLAIVLIILSISNKFVQKILNPLETLILKMETFANSHTPEEFKINSEYKFFKRLSESFNKMQNKILKREKELDSLNKTLENRVLEEVEKNRIKDQQIINQSRLAQMGEMLSMIAHQWRQPLSAISATSGNLKLKAQLNKLDPKTTIALSDKISDYAQHLSSTIDDFRDFFKTKQERRKTSYDEILESVLNIVETSIKSKNIKLLKKCDSKAEFLSSPNELKQVLLNLIKNAEDILLERDIKNPTITIETDNNILRVIDNGGGVDKNIIDKIFDPYFSTKTKRDGVGLGLYMSKIIIEEHCKGKLTVQSDNNQAIFTIELPTNYMD